MPNTESLISPRTAAKRLGIGYCCFLDMIADGLIPAVNVSRNIMPRYKIRPEDLQAFIESRMTQTKPRPARRRRRENEIKFIK